MTRTSPLGIVSLVVGIASCCLIFIPYGIGLVFPVAAIVLGVMGMRQCDQDPNVTGKGLAIAGLVLGIVFALIGLTLLIIGVFFLDILEQWAEEMEDSAQMVFSRS